MTGGGPAPAARQSALDLGTVRAELEAAAPRVACPEHGVVVAAVPWARHGAAHTRFFDDQVAWLAAACPETTITQLMRISWRTVGHIIARVSAEAGAATDRLAGLRRIGIDEISYKRGHKYLVIVVDHDSGLLIWAAPGHDRKTLEAFFDRLGPGRAAELTHVSADGADWICGVVAARAPQAVLCAGPVPRRLLGHRRPGRGPPRGLAPGTGSRRARQPPAQQPGPAPVRRQRPRPQARPLHAMEKPRKPHQPAAGQTRLDRENPPLPLPRLRAQRRTTSGIPAQRRRRQIRPRPLAVLGGPLPHPRIHRTRAENTQAPGNHPRNPRPRPQQRPDRISEHQNPRHHPHGLRIPQPRRPHRPGHARPRRPPTRPPRKMITNLPTEPAGGPQMLRRSGRKRRSARSARAPRLRRPGLTPRTPGRRRCPRRGRGRRYDVLPLAMLW